MAENDQEKTEEATTQRRDEFRRDGRIAQSRELVIVMSLFMVAIIFISYGSIFLSESQKVLAAWLKLASDSSEKIRDPKGLIIAIFADCTRLAWPFILGGIIVALAVQMIQTGFVFRLEALQPDFGRISPLNGLKKMFSLRGLMETAKSLIKLVVLGGIGFFYFQRLASVAPGWTMLNIEQQIAKGFTIAGEFLLAVIILLAVLGIIDYFFQRFELEKEMRMTKQEVKEETKQREGDPMIRARVRNIMRDRTRKRMMTDVPKADVVITNPTHFAVALFYDQEKFAAPRVVAKGADFMAEKIKEIARRHNVPIVENKPLARILYRTLKVGHFVPRELYNAVAEVLAYVYKLKRTWKDGVN